MSFINVSIDISGALKKLRMISQDAKSAIPRALNKTATSGRAQAVREIRAAGYNIKAGVVRSSINIRKASQAELQAIIRATGKSIPLINFGASWSRRSPGVTVNVQHGRKLIEGAFIATMPGGHKGVFVRVKSAAHAKLLENHGIKAYRGFRKESYGHGLPIRQLFGPSVPAAFANEDVQRNVVAAIRSRFPTVLAQELRFATLK